MPTDFEVEKLRIEKELIATNRALMTMVVALNHQINQLGMAFRVFDDLKETPLYKQYVKDMNKRLGLGGKKK